MRALEMGGMLDNSELKGARKVLTAAALTYVAALLTSVMQILYYASRFRPNNRR
jgi:Zn-dependent membrane protease YugP